MSFKESVIIPLKLFEKCFFEKETKIIQNETLPTDMKIKLHTQERIQLNRKQQQNEDKNKSEEIQKLPRDKILNTTAVVKQPFVNSIIDIIEKYRDIIYWDETYKLYIHKELMPQYNIIDIFGYLFKRAIVTKNTDIPNGSKEIYDILIEIGVPKPWIYVSFPKVSDRKKRKALDQEQTGEGKKSKNIHWVNF